jgi:hypothetical protein
MSENYEQSFYAVLNQDTGEYFAGFNPEAGKAETSTSPMGAKLFSNKHDVKLRPNESLVEVTVSLNKDNTQISEPFRPRRREKKVITK